MKTTLLKTACPMLAVIMLSAIGCNRGPQTAKVSGTMTYKGKPVAFAHLMFATSTGRAGFADVDEQGHFEAFTFKPGDGLLVGEHVVTLTPHFNVPPNDKSSRNVGESAEGNQQLTQWWPDKYRNVQTSPLKITVEPGKVNEFNLTLED